MLDFLRPIQVPPERIDTVTLDYVASLLRNMQIEQSSMAARMARMETRMVNLMLANGLDTNGKPIGDQ